MAFMERKDRPMRKLVSVFVRLESRDILKLYDDGTSDMLPNYDKEFVQITRDPRTNELLMLMPINPMEVSKI